MAKGSQIDAVPRWALELKERIRAQTAHVLVLHFNVADLVPFGQEFVPLPPLPQPLHRKG